MAEGKNLVGVDIGASSIKVVLLKEARKRLTVVRYGYMPLPPQTIVDGHVMNRPAVLEAISRLFREQRIPQKECAIGVYGQSVIVRKITVPLMTNAELAEQITWEAEQHIPFDIKVMNIDYEVLRRRPEAGQMDLLLVAAKKDEINDYASIVKEARIKPTVVDINAFTVQNVFEYIHGLPDDQTVALLNIGATVSSLNIVSRGVSAFTREVTNAGNTITEEIQRQLGVPFDQAEQYKLGAAHGQAPPQVMQVILQACDSLAGEIQRSLDFYLATSGETEIHRVYVCGGSAFLQPLVQAVEKRARVPVMVLDPLANLAVDPKTVNEAELRSRSPQLCVAVGLALRADKERRDLETRRVRINLLAQRKETSRRASTGAGGQAWVGLVVLAMLLEIAGLAFFHSSQQTTLTRINGDNTDLQTSIDKIKKDTADHPKIKAELAQLRDREDAIQKLQAARTGPTSVLLELSRILTVGRGPTVDHDKLEQLKRDNPGAVPNPNWDPRRLWLTKYSEVDRNVKIEGLARDGEDVAEFLRRLALSDFFYEVKPLPATEVVDKDTHISLKQFAVSAKVKY